MNFVETEFDNEIAELKAKIEELYKPIAELKAKINELDYNREEAIIRDGLYMPMDKFEEAWKSVFGDEKYPAAEVAFVTRWGNSDKLTFFTMEDGGECDWPRLVDGRPYWNTYELGIFEWDEKEKRYAHWYHHNVTYFDILGFVSIEDANQRWGEEE